MEDSSGMVVMGIHASLELHAEGGKAGSLVEALVTEDSQESASRLREL